MDHATRQAIIDFLEGETMKRAGDMQKVWLSKRRLIDQFGMFTSDWVNTYGHLLPRKRLTVVDRQNDCKRVTGWAYDRDFIQQMLQEKEPTILVDGDGTARILNQREFLHLDI